jgi:hypothetical protein
MARREITPTTRQAGPSAAGGAPDLLHLYYWLRWQMFGSLLPDGYGEGSR